MAAASSADDAVRFSVEEVQNALDEASQRSADAEWSIVQVNAQENIGAFRANYEAASGIAEGLVDAVGLAWYVIEQVQVTADMVDPDNRLLVGVPKRSPNGLWRDGGRFDRNRRELAKQLEELGEMVTLMEDRLQNVQKWADINGPDAEDEVDDDTREMLDAFIETLAESQEGWEAELVGLAREVHRLSLATLATRDALNGLPTRPPIGPNFEEAKWVNENALPEALRWSPESRSEEDRGASPVTTPSPTPQMPSPSGDHDAYGEGVRRQIQSKPGKGHLQIKDMTPCEYFEEHMRTADPILLTWYSFEAIERDWKWWRSQNPPQMPTMNTVFIKKTFFDWDSAYTRRPLHTSEAITWVVDHSVPRKGVDAEWRSKRAGERFFVVDGTNLFYKNTVEQWDEHKRIRDIAKDGVPVGERYGPIIIVLQSHVFEDKVLKYGDPHATFLSDTGIRLMHNLLRPLHGGHDYPIHIVEICAELCKHSFAKKVGDDRFPCIDMVRDGNGVSLCRLLDRDNANPLREHKFCEYDDAVGTLLTTALKARQKDVVVVTGEGGDDRDKGVKKYLKEDSNMRVIWAKMQAMGTRATTRVYRMGYNRAVRLYVENELREEGALDAYVDAM
jgi:hypothetical protein